MELFSRTEMNIQIGPKVKQVWNVEMHVLNNFWGFVINTTAYILGQFSLHLLLLKSSMIELLAGNFSSANC